MDEEWLVMACPLCDGPLALHSLEQLALEVLEAFGYEPPRQVELVDTDERL